MPFDDELNDDPEEMGPIMGLSDDDDDEEEDEDEMDGFNLGEDEDEEAPVVAPEEDEE